MKGFSMSRCITLLDQHQSPAAVAAQARREETAINDYEAQAKAVTAATRQYEADLRTWRASRPEHKEFVAAVKREANTDELTLLAARAGVTANEIIAARAGRKSALGLQGLAEQYPAAKKEFERLEKEALQLEADLDAAATHGEVGRIEDALHSRGDALGAARRRAAETQMAAEVVEGARKSGLI
jgi:hypothetical protein